MHDLAVTIFVLIIIMISCSGYMAPEYAMKGRLSVKSDVYSFGVIVLEVVSGHKCNSTAFPYHEESLIQRVSMKLQNLRRNNANLQLMNLH